MLGRKKRPDSMAVVLDKLWGVERKKLRNVVDDSLNHPDRFYAGAWAEVVRQAAIVGAIGEARRHHPKHARQALAEFIGTAIEDSPSGSEVPPMEWMMGREYVSATVDVLDMLPAEEDE